MCLSLFFVSTSGFQQERLKTPTPSSSSLLSTHLWTEPVLMDFYQTRNTVFLNLLFYYVWYSWNLFFLKSYLTGPPSHRQNANFWLVSALGFLASIPIFHHGTIGRCTSEHWKKKKHKNFNRHRCLLSNSKFKNHRNNFDNEIKQQNWSCV